MVSGPAFAINDIAAGRRAARSISCYLNGEPLEAEEEEGKPESLSEEGVAGNRPAAQRGADGFFMERHVKLAPIATMTEGIFIAGCCEGPRDIPDTVAQAKAAASDVCWRGQGRDRAYCCLGGRGGLLRLRPVWDCVPL